MAHLFQGIRNIAQRESLVPEVGDLTVEPSRTPGWRLFVPGRVGDPERVKLQADSFCMVRTAGPEDAVNQAQASILRSASIACSCFALRDRDVDRQGLQFFHWLSSELELCSANSKDKIERLSCHYLEKPKTSWFHTSEGIGQAIPEDGRVRCQFLRMRSIASCRFLESLTHSLPMNFV